MTTTYNPFHHLVNLKYAHFEGDPMMRLAFMELIKQNNLTFDGPYANAMETTNLSADILLAVYDELYEDGLNESYYNQRTADRVATEIISALTTHVTSEDDSVYEGWVPDLAQADKQAVLAAIKGAWTPEETPHFRKRNWSDATQTAIRRPATAMSAHFTVKPFGTAIVGIVEGGLNDIPERSRFLSRMSGPYHMTWKACKEWGFRIPKTAGFPDTNDVLLNITFNKPPKDVFLRIVSSTDDVPDPDKPGEMKSEGHTVELTKGKNRNQLALTSHDLKYHDWVFTARDDRSTE